MEEGNSIRYWLSTTNVLKQHKGYYSTRDTAIARLMDIITDSKPWYRARLKQASDREIKVNLDNITNPRHHHSHREQDTYKRWHKYTLTDLEKIGRAHV